MPAKDRKDIVEIATFPHCAACEQLFIPHVTDAPISVQVGKGETQSIPRSQEAAMLRFMARMNKPVLVNHLEQAIGSHEVPRCLSRLRNDWGIPIPCAKIPKRLKPGTQGAYYLGPEVRVWENEAEKGADGAE